MHKNEFNIDEALVESLLNQQFSDLAGLPLRKVEHYGTDNAIFRIGEEYAIRLPRVDYAAKQIKKEIKWLPKFKDHLQVSIPQPVKIGKASKEFPHEWYVYRWIKGNDAYNFPPSNLNQLAQDLADFIKSLWKLETVDAPKARRGLPLATQESAVVESISSLKDIIDIEKITTIWQECSNAQEWKKPPVWLHADLLPSNILLHNGKLNALIDFGLMGIGDPACDLIPAWCIFDSKSRAIYRESLAVDDNTWLRGKGWALAIALTIIPYYLKTNPVLVSVANRMIDEITANS